jgi:hypothetical protein
MTKKRSRGKGKKRSSLATGRSASTAVTEVIERIAAAGPDYFQDNFARLMIDSATLGQEPEFADLYFDSRQTLQAAARHSPRLMRRLKRVARRAGEGAILVYDDYRIAVLNDLDTPQFRQELQRRLARCTDRLMGGNDADKIEIALFLALFLMPEARKVVRGKKPLPLGVYGLVTTIYEDSFDRAMAEIPEARDIIDDTLYDLWCARHSKEDMAIIRAAVEQIDAFEELAVRMETDPALTQAWRRQESYLIEEFQTHMAQAGLSIEPSFFTPDEAALPVAMMEQRYWNRPWSPSRYFAAVAMLNFMRCIIEAVDEIVSPERVTQMSQGLKSVGQMCLQADDERLRALVPNIQAAIHHLQSKARPSQNKVVTTLYLMSLSLAMDEESLSPQWRRFLERTQKSRLMRRFTRAAGLSTDS